MLALACILAIASGAYALHLWGQLAVADSGGPVACPFDSEGDCADVWRSGAALAVERATGLPVAAHGVLWSLVAFALPAAVVAARARGGAGTLAWAGAVVTALVGVAVVVALAAAQYLDGRFCGSCGISYAITLAYAGVCLLLARVPWPLLARGGAVAGGVAVLGFAGLALAAPERPAGGAARAPAAAGGAHDPHAGHDHGPGHGEPALEFAAEGLERFLANLSPESAAALARDLATYRANPKREVGMPRALIGSPMAPVRISDWADFRCSHCAELHATLTQILAVAPPGSLSVDSHYFPLDGTCNPNIRAARDGVGCVASKVLLCLENDPAAFQLAGEYYTRQRTLTADQVYELAAPLRSRSALEKCVAAPETEAKLKQDIDTAMSFGISGTPLVLVNGKESGPRASVLLALVLSGGNLDHPALASILKPKDG